MATYYVIESNNVGPNADPNDHTYTITTAPATGNMDHEPVIDGWAGTTQDVAIFGRGEYATEAEALAKIARLAGDDGYRESEDDILDEDTVAVYLHGRYSQMTADETRDWLYDDASRRVTRETTDAEIDALVDQADAAAQSEIQNTIDRDAAWQLYDDARKRRGVFEPDAE